MSESTLDRLVKASVAAFEAMPREAQEKLLLAQQRSWVVGEMLIEHPGMTREEAEKLVEEQS